MQNSHLPIPLNPGYRLQNWYEIVRVLGRGRHGVTYQAYESNLERTLAVKEYLPADLARRDSGVLVQAAEPGAEDAYHIGLETFLEEARVLARVEHPNIPGIINVFVAHNTAYMVMGYEEGESLESLLQRRRTLEEAELLQILMPLLSALEKLHDCGHIHGELKPEHVLIRPDGSPVLLDFGATRRAVAELTHAVHAAPGFSPPEAYFGKKEQLGPPADIYGLAAILYRAVAGVAPSDALDRSRSVISEAHDPLIPCSQVGIQRYSQGLLGAIDCALKLDPEERPRTIGAWRREFGSAPAGQRETTRLRADATAGFSPPSSRRPPSGAEEGSRTRLMIGGLLAAALLLLGGRAWLNRHDPSRDAIEPRPGIAGTLETPLPSATSGNPAAEQEKALDAKVAALLSAARADVDNGRVFYPADDNALARYRAALALKPGLPEAKEGLRRIADVLIRKAREAIEGHDWAKAQEYLDEAGSVLPDLDKLAAARKELHASMQVSSRRTTEEAARRSGLAEQAAQLTAVARRAIARGRLDKAEVHINKIEAFMPGWEELPQLRRELQQAGQQAESTPPPELATPPDGDVQKALRRARKALQRHQWEKAQERIDKARAMAPDSEDIALLQGELNLHMQAVQEPTSAEQAKPQAPAQVNIRGASVSTPIARPGDTLEFLTEYALSLPEGESDRQVTATWTLMRNGRRIGKEGATSMPAKPGVHSTTTEFMLPAYMKAGTYVVEHRVGTGKVRDSARSSFRVETR